MQKGIKTYNNLSRQELLDKLTKEFQIQKPEVAESKVQYNASTGTLIINEKIRMKTISDSQKRSQQ